MKWFIIMYSYQYFNLLLMGNKYFSSLELNIYIWPVSQLIIFTLLILSKNGIISRDYQWQFICVSLWGNPWFHHQHTLKKTWVQSVMMKGDGLTGQQVESVTWSAQWYPVKTMVDGWIPNGIKWNQDGNNICNYKIHY